MVWEEEVVVWRGGGDMGGGRRWWYGEEVVVWRGGGDGMEYGEGVAHSYILAQLLYNSWIVDAVVS